LTYKAPTEPESDEKARRRVTKDKVTALVDWLNENRCIWKCCSRTGGIVSIELHGGVVVSGKDIDEIKNKIKEAEKAKGGLI